MNRSGSRNNGGVEVEQEVGLRRSEDASRWQSCQPEQNIAVALEADMEMPIPVATLSYRDVRGIDDRQCV